MWQASLLEINIWIWQLSLGNPVLCNFSLKLFITLWESYAIFKVGSRQTSSNTTYESVFVCDIFRQMPTFPIISTTPLAKLLHLKFTKPVSQNMVLKLRFTKLELQFCFSKFTSCHCSISQIHSEESDRKSYASISKCLVYICDPNKQTTNIV